MDLYSWQLLSNAEKQSLKDEMREAAARMDDLFQRGDLSESALASSLSFDRLS
jgi:hypothetical protein